MATLKPLAPEKIKVFGEDSYRFTFDSLENNHGLVRIVLEGLHPEKGRAGTVSVVFDYGQRVNYLTLFKSKKGMFSIDWPKIVTVAHPTQERGTYKISSTDNLVYWLTTMLSKGMDVQDCIDQVIKGKAIRAARSQNTDGRVYDYDAAGRSGEAIAYVNEQVNKAMQYILKKHALLLKVVTVVTADESDETL